MQLPGNGGVENKQLPPRELPRLLYCDVAELGGASRQSRANVKPFAVENRIGHYVLQHVSHEDEGNQSARVLGDAVLRQVLQSNTVLWCRVDLGEFGAQFGHGQRHPSHL